MEMDEYSNEGITIKRANTGLNIFINPSKYFNNDLTKSAFSLNNGLNNETARSTVTTTGVKFGEN